MTNITNFNFRGADVRTVVLPNGEPGFVGKDVAERLGYEDPTTAIRSHCRGVQILHPIPDALGRMQQTRILTEPDVLRLIVSSTLPEAEAFERWVFEEVLPSIRRTGSYTAPASSPVEALQVADALATMLRLEGSARLGVARKALEIAAPHLLPLAPVYAIDAPAGAPAVSSEPTESPTSLMALRLDGPSRLKLMADATKRRAPALAPVSSEPTESLTALMARFRVGVSTRAGNLILQERGLLEKRTRPSSSGTAKSFWSITKKGLAFGKNISSPENPRETQPHWFSAKGEELLRVMGVLE